MSLLPDPISDVLLSKLEGKIANAVLSSQLSAWISFLWTFGKKNLLGLGPALQNMAAAQYLTLQKLESKDFLTLTVPQDMLNPDNLSQFETEEKTK